MKSFAVALAFAAAAFAQFTVNTPPSVVTCEPTALSWSGGVPPYIPSILPGGQPTAPALKSFPQQTATTLTWNVDLAAQPISVAIKDSTGALQYSAIINITTGTNSTCVSAVTSVTPIASAPATTAAGSTPASSAPPASGNTPPAAATTHASSSGAASASSTAKPNGAFTVGISTIGFAGLAGLIGAALF